MIGSSRSPQSERADEHHEGHEDDARDPASKGTAIKEIFAEASDLPVDRRTAFLAERCGADGELRGYVQRYHWQRGSWYLDPDPIGSGARRRSPSSKWPRLN